LFQVRRRQVQERGWIYGLQQLPDRLDLTRTEYGFGQLHLQRWLFWAEWRDMRGVRRRQVQELGWRCELQHLPDKLELTRAEHSFEQLHLQRRMVGG